MSITRVELTPEQAQQWQSTMSLMAWTCPGFQHLFYKLLTRREDKYFAVPTTDVPVAATDGANIMINPDPFFKYSLKERVFIAAHEVVHNVFGDVGLLHRLHGKEHVTMNDGTTLPYDEATMQRAMDYRINALLVSSKIGAMPRDALYDPAISSDKDTALDVYQKLYENHGGQGGGGSPGSGPGKGNQQGNNGFDQLAPPGTSSAPGQAPPPPPNPQQWAVEMAAAKHLESMRHKGNLPGGMKHMFEEILEPKVPWQDHIKAIVQRSVGSNSYNWKRPDRRFIVQDIYMPSKSGFGAGWIVVWGDTSGSIGDVELNKYLGELSGVLEDTRPRRVSVVWCDCQIHHVDEVTDTDDLRMIKARGVGGRGGTSVEPVFDWIAESTEQPDMFIGFTDGEVSFPDQPPYPVVWASVQKDQEYPYGEVVQID